MTWAVAPRLRRAAPRRVLRVAACGTVSQARRTLCASCQASKLDAQNAPSASGIELSPLTVHYTHTCAHARALARTRAHARAQVENLRAAKEAVKQSVAVDRTQIYAYNDK